MKKATAVLTVLATMFLAAPALACGPDPDEVQIRAAVLSDRWAPPLQDVQFDIREDGRRATAVVAWGPSDNRSEQLFQLANDGTMWRVVSRGYVVSGGMLREIAED